MFAVFSFVLSCLFVLGCSLPIFPSRLFFLVCSLSSRRFIPDCPFWLVRSRVYLLACSLSLHPFFNTSLHCSVCIHVLVLSSHSYVFAPAHLPPSPFRSRFMFVPACSFSLHLLALACPFLRLIVSLHLCVPACLLTPFRSRQTVYPCLFVPCCLLPLVHFRDFLSSARCPHSLYSVPHCLSLFFSFLFHDCLPSPVHFLLVAFCLLGSFRTFPPVHSRLFVRSRSLSHVYPHVFALFCLLLPVCSLLFLPGSLSLITSCSFPPSHSACSDPPVHSLLFILVYSLPPVR